MNSDIMFYLSMQSRYTRQNKSSLDGYEKLDSGGHRILGGRKTVIEEVALALPKDNALLVGTSCIVGSIS